MSEKMDRLFNYFKDIYRPGGKLDCPDEWYDSLWEMHESLKKVFSRYGKIGGVKYYLIKVFEKENQLIVYFNPPLGKANEVIMDTVRKIQSYNESKPE